MYMYIMPPQPTYRKTWCDRTTKAYPVSCRNRSVTSGPNLAKWLEQSIQESRLDNHSG